MSKSKILIIFLTVLFTPWASMAEAGWKDMLDKVTGAQATPAGALSQSEIGEGLRQALQKGIENAVSSLGSPDGFMGNPEVKIPMPENLQTLEKAARTVGQDHIADEFILSMNRAGEQAVPETLDILTKAAANLTVEDARSILNGPEDAATRYFERTSREDLFQRILPIVEQATDSVGVTSRYKGLVESAGPLARMTGGSSELDLDNYVTDKSLDGLFLLMAREEQRIRENPAARTTKLLQKVFSR